MQRILIVITLTLLFNVSCSLFNKNKGKDKKKKFEPVKIEKIVQQGQFNKLWTQKFDGGKKSYGYKLVPFIDNKSVYVASLKGEVTKLNTETGEVSWSVDLNTELSAGPGVGSEILLVGTPEGEVIALDKENGNQLWSEKLSSEILSPPVIDNQMAIVRAQDGRVYALNAGDGKREWLFDTNIPNLTLRGNSQPVVRAGRIYIGFDNGKVAAIKQESGDVIWLQNVVDSKGKTELARIVDIDGDMALIATDLYLSSAVGKTIAVATESGRVMWSKDKGSAAGVTASRSKLFIIDNESNVRALNRSDGTEEWKTTAYKNRLLTKPVFYLGDVIVGDLEGYIHVLDGEDGSTIARTRMGKLAFYTQPVGSGSILIAYNKDGTLTAFEYSR
ncbi:MAG: outer membrane protein assembly factor BamB [Alcanivoracaceae bacterium]|nr:outer membrane protein assembly factor BamB [Alcanivoracaceae bacterium]